MDGSFPQGVGASSYGGFDLMNQRPIPQPLLPFNNQTCDHHHPNNKSTTEKSDDENDNEEDIHNKSTKASSSPWQRVKWTDKMIKLLITAVSYIGDDHSHSIDNTNRRKFAVLQKKGKWKSISKVMSERSYHVSPQQCEDKFNDLNKRYKKLNDMIGRGTCCKVVENPKLLDTISHLNDKEKDDVRKIMSSKHLFYEEMCSYHNGNRLHLPHDLALQRSLHLALRNKDDHDHDDEEDHDDEDGHGDEHDEYEEHHHPLKKARYEDGEQPSTLMPLLSSQGGGVESGGSGVQKGWIEARSLYLEEQKIQIKVEKLELEKQRFRWERFSKKRDQELEMMRMENERMKIENEKMRLELKHKELGVEL